MAECDFNQRAKPSLRVAVAAVPSAWLEAPTISARMSPAINEQKISTPLMVILTAESSLRGQLQFAVQL